MPNPVGRPMGPRVTVRCRVCGTESQRRVSNVERNTTGQFFCSKACRCQASLKPKSGYLRPCQICGTNFYRHKSGHQKFCSRSCYDEHQRRFSVTSECASCGVEYQRPPNRSRNYCSLRCSHRDNTKHDLGWRHNGRPATLSSHGYVLVYEPEHPAAKSGRVPQHRLVLEQQLGRILSFREHVHHINGVKTDNRLENLRLMSINEHAKLEWAARRDLTIKQLQNRLDEYERRFGPLKE